MEDLEIENFEIADNGLIGYEKYINDPDKFDIILMDINMPEMDGVEAAKSILKFEQKHKLAHTPIVALTANTLPGDKEKYLNSGFDGYLPKPIDEDSLVEVMHDLVSKS